MKKSKRVYIRLDAYEPIIWGVYDSKESLIEDITREYNERIVFFKEKGIEHKESLQDIIDSEFKCCVHEKEVKSVTKYSEVL